MARQDAQRQRSHRGRRLIAAAAVAAGMMVPTAVAAQEYPTPDTTPNVPTDPSDPSDPADPGGSSYTGARSGGSTLPVTGGQIAGLTLIGLGAAGAGLVLVRLGRRPARESLSL